MRRAIELTGTDSEPLEVSKATAVKTNKRFIHFDELDDGTWRSMWSPDLIPDFSKIEALAVIREENEL